MYESTTECRCLVPPNWRCAAMTAASAWTRSASSCGRDFKCFSRVFLSLLNTRLQTRHRDRRLFDLSVSFAAGASLHVIVDWSSRQPGKTVHRCLPSNIASICRGQVSAFRPPPFPWREDASASFAFFRGGSAAASFSLEEDAPAPFAASSSPSLSPKTQISGFHPRGTLSSSLGNGANGSCVCLECCAIVPRHRSLRWGAERRGYWG